MDQSEYRCYYKECGKLFQTKAYLTTHINAYHIDSRVVQCPICNNYFSNLTKYKIHKKLHSDSPKKTGSGQIFGDLGLVDHNLYDIMPPNILKLPILPPIDSERSRLGYAYKIPINVYLFDQIFGGK